MSDLRPASSGRPSPSRFRGGLAVLSGPSGSGKTSIRKALLEDPRVTLSISATTRTPREGEKNGVDYWFHPRAEFERLARESAFVEWAEVYGNLYGTPRAPLVAAASRHDRLMLLDIDVQGAAQLRKQQIPATYVFVAPPTLQELRERLLKRGADRPEVIERRLAEAQREMAQQHLYDHVVVNRDLAQTIREVRVLLGL